VPLGPSPSYRCSPVGLDLDAYREEAERFMEELSREYYLHLAGHKPELAIEPIYERHADLFVRRAVEGLRELEGAAVEGDERRRLRYLLHFAFDGLLGEETKAEAQELAHLEASLEVEVNGAAVPYRAVPIEQANEPDGERRAALEAGRDALLDERLNPLHRLTVERSHELCRRLGWSSYAEACAELRGVDLDALAAQAASFLRATEGGYATVADPELDRAGVPALGELRRSDLPRFFRAAPLDGIFPAERLLDSLAETLAGLGIELYGQPNVRLDTESRPTKSSRAFCSTPRVPDEVYLVIAPSGGRDDYSALFHEGGHTEHYANTDPGLPFEFRHLGDNSVTESFAFLLEHLVEEPLWLRERLGVAEPEPAVTHARAERLVLTRRYAAKLAYELELHSPAPDFDALPDRYAELLATATRVRWPRTPWLSDVDGGFYVACYLQAWALETRWRAALRERFGERWFSSPAAGEWLRDLWRQGQRLDAAELFGETLGGEVDLADLVSDLNG
jgi:hypothetical protein